METGYAEHKERVIAEGPGTLSCGVITVSNSPQLENDRNGQLIVEQLSGAGHSIVLRTIVPDETGHITALLAELTTAGCGVIILNGGIGIAKRASTFDGRFLQNRRQ